MSSTKIDWRESSRVGMTAAAPLPEPVGDGDDVGGAAIVGVVLGWFAVPGGDWGPVIEGRIGGSGPE